jgi:hypothetical protein
LRVFEKKELMIIFGPKSNETLESRILRNEELLNLKSTPNTIGMFKLKGMRWAGNLACMEKKINAYKALLGKLKGKKPLGKPRRRWVYNIKMYLKEIGCGHMQCTDTAKIGTSGEIL